MGEEGQEGLVESVGVLAAIEGTVQRRVQLWEEEKMKGVVRKMREEEKREKEERRGGKGRGRKGVR